MGFRYTSVILQEFGSIAVDDDPEGAQRNGRRFQESAKTMGETSTEG